MTFPVRTAIADAVASAVASATQDATGAIQRIFITVNGVDEYFTLQNPVVETGDFAHEVFISTTSNNTNYEFIIGSFDSGNRMYVAVRNGLLVLGNGTSFPDIAGSTVGDSKGHLVKLELAGSTVSLSLDGAVVKSEPLLGTPPFSFPHIGVNDTLGVGTFFNGIIANPDLGNGNAWQLNRPFPATTEQSTGGTNLLTYVGAPKTELFTFNQSDGRWENAFFPNLLIRTEEIDNDVWTKSSGVSVSPNATLAPDGSLTADELTPSTGGNFVEVSQNVSVTIGQPCTQTYFVKDNGLQFIQIIGPSSIFGTFNVNFDVVNEIITQSNTGTSTGLISSITSAADGFFRIRVTVDALANSSNGRLALDFIKTGTTGRGVNEGDFNGSDSIFAWGGQFVKGASPLNYKKTVDIAGRSIQIA